MVSLSFTEKGTTGIEVLPYSFAPGATKITMMTGIQKQEFLEYHQHISSVISEQEELLSYWHAWCVMMGGKNLEILAKNWSIWTNGGQISQDVVELDNLFTCEAHHELMKTYLKMLCVDGIAAVTPYEAKLKSLQKGIIPLHDSF